MTEQVGPLLAVLADDVCSTKTLMERLGLSHRPTFLHDSLRPALAAGWIEMTDPAHPRSPRQRYRLTGRLSPTARPSGESFRSLTNPSRVS